MELEFIVAGAPEKFSLLPRHVSGSTIGGGVALEVTHATLTRRETPLRLSGLSVRGGGVQLARIPARIGGAGTAGGCCVSPLSTGGIVAL